MNHIDIKRNIGIQIKPVGSECNLRCAYCYVAPFRKNDSFNMNLELFKKVIMKSLNYAKTVTLSWHGGEPLLIGYQFFEEAINFMKKYDNTRIINILQTNGTLLTRDFASLLKECNFSISISLDGDEIIHNIHRKDLSNKGSFHMTMKGIENLRNVGINPPIIVTVTKTTFPYAKDVFNFLAKNGFKKIKFSPVFDTYDCDFSISADLWYEYLNFILESWISLNDPTIEIRELDEVIAWLTQETISTCSSNQSCVNWVSIDPNGNVYPCEYLRADFLYGNIKDNSFYEIFESNAFHNFNDKCKKTPKKCTSCNFYSICGNGCPATRIKDGILSYDGVYVYCEQRINLFKRIKEIYYLEE